MIIVSREDRQSIIMFDMVLTLMTKVDLNGTEGLKELFRTEKDRLDSDDKETIESIINALEKYERSSDENM